jgi:hypothetical protein
MMFTKFARRLLAQAAQPVSVVWLRLALSTVLFPSLFLPTLPRQDDVTHPRFQEVSPSMLPGSADFRLATRFSSFLFCFPLENIRQNILVIERSSIFRLRDR